MWTTILCTSTTTRSLIDRTDYLLCSHGLSVLDYRCAYVTKALRLMASIPSRTKLNMKRAYDVLSSNSQRILGERMPKLRGKYAIARFISLCSIHHETDEKING